MELLFTQHSLMRMSERAISEDEVYEVFENPVLVLERMEALIIGKSNRGRFLTLVLDKTRKKLLTVHPSSRKQRRLYQERGEPL